MSTTVCHRQFDGRPFLSIGYSGHLQPSLARTVASDGKIIAELNDSGYYSRKEQDTIAEIEHTCMVVKDHYIAVAQTPKEGASHVMIVAPERRSVPARFTLPVRCLSICKDNLAIGSADGKVVLYDLEGGDLIDFQVPSASVRDVALSEKHLAVALANGLLIVFDRTTKKELFNKPVFRVETESSQEAFKMAWSPDGSALALPGFEKVQFLTEGGWEILGIPSQHKTDITRTSWSVDGKSLATLSKDNALSIWDWATREVKVFKPSTEGESRVVDITFDSKRLLCVHDHFIESRVTEKIAKKLVKKSAAKFKNNAFTEEESDDDFGRENRTGGLDSDSDDDNDDEKEGSEKAPEVEGEAAAEPEAEAVAEDNEAIEAAYDDEVEGAIVETKKEVLQASFMPNATKDIKRGRMEVGSKGRSHYLCYNRSGFLSVREQQVTEDDMHRRVEVGNVAVGLSNRSHTYITIPREYEVGSLSKHGVVLGAKEVKAVGMQLQHVPSRVYVRLDGAMTQETNDWSYDYPAGEDIVAVTIGSFVAVATNEYLRVYSIAGLQLSVDVLPGPCISLAAMEGVLFVVYQDPAAPYPAADGEIRQRLGYEICHLTTGKVLSSGLLPLAPGTLLKNIGISDEAVPFYTDTRDRLFGLLPVRADLRWTPLLNMASARTSLMPDEGFFVVSVSDTEARVLCTDNGDQPEAASATYGMRKMPLCIPLLDMDNAFEKLQESIVRMGHMRKHLHYGHEQQLPANALKNIGSKTIGQATSMADAEHEKTVLKLFQQLAQAGFPDRAVDAVKLAISVKTKQFALNMAENMLQQRDLADEIRSLIGATQEVAPPRPRMSATPVQSAPSTPVPVAAKRAAPDTAEKVQPTTAFSSNPFAAKEKSIPARGSFLDAKRPRIA